MKAIRGATTVENDTEKEIDSAVKQLLYNIENVNKLNREDIICILFSNTTDLKSCYPAKAARKAGFISCALYSSAEPEISGALPKCIRVMVLADIKSAPRHVYLNEAANLRKDLTKKFNIAVDGPAGSGKSTISKIVSEKLNILYLDTGAMYRACALACLKKGIDCADGAAVKTALEKCKITVEYENGAQKTMVDGKDVSDEIRTPEVSMAASAVSSHEWVRKTMVELQRKIAAGRSCILDGRDVGTNVLPDAEYKFFLTASPEERSRRRLKENEAKGYAQTFEEVLAEITERDENDSNRKFAPLIKAADAVEVFTDGMTVEEVVNYIIDKLQGTI